MGTRLKNSIVSVNNVYTIPIVVRIEIAAIRKEALELSFPLSIYI